MRLASVVALTAALLMTGCSSAGDDASEPPDSEAAETTNRADDLAARMAARERLGRIPGERTPVEDTAPPTGEVPTAVLDRVTTDAMERTGVAAADLEIIRSESLIFSDGSLGCPKPDVVYTQAPVPGYRVVLDADGQSLDYRVTERGYMMLCQQTGLRVSPGGGAEDR